MNTALFNYKMKRKQITVKHNFIKYNDTSANEDNSFRNHIR